MSFNLICFSAIIGIVLFVNSISLPEPLYNALHYASITTVCLSMIVIGSLLAAAKIKEVLKDKTVYIFSFFTLIVMAIPATIPPPPTGTTSASTKGTCSNNVNRPINKPLCGLER